MTPQISTSVFGNFNGREIKKIRVFFEGKLAASIINYGAIITEISVPDKWGVPDNIVLSYDSLEEYLGDKYYLGAAIGRYANRISNGHFILQNQEINLSQNQTPNHLHGGFNGFHNKVWEIESISPSESRVEIHFSLISKDGDEGYPGKLNTDFYFRVEPNKISINFRGLSDKDSIFNPTHHSYFNLSGRLNKEINTQTLQVNADKIVELNSNDLATGNFQNVDGSVFDFRNARSIQQDFDHCWVLNSSDAAVLKDPESGRRMKIECSSPGLQVYTANEFNGEIIGSNKRTFFKHHSICLEPEYFPDSPNHSIFPKPIIKAGQKKEIWISYTFDINDKK